MRQRKTKSSCTLPSGALLNVLFIIGIRIPPIHVTLKLEEKISFANCRGETLRGVLHHPEKAGVHGAVILCHGMESDKESDKLVSLCRSLAQKNIPALRFDFAYAGESSGKFEDITYSGGVEDLRAAFALVQSRYKGKTVVLGSSMGGTVALLHAAEEPTVTALVTVAAPLHPEQFPRRVLTPDQMQQWRKLGFTNYNGKRINVSLLHDLERIDVPKAIRKIKCPVLILHGDADEIVPVEEAYELHAGLDLNRLSILQGADHRLSNPAAMQRAITEALDWITEHVR